MKRQMHWKNAHSLGKL